MPSGAHSRQLPLQGIRLAGTAREGPFRDGFAVQEPGKGVILNPLIAKIGDGDGQELLRLGGEPQVGDGDIGCDGWPDPHASDGQPARQWMAAESVGSGPLEIADDDDGSGTRCL